MRVWIWLRRTGLFGGGLLMGFGDGCQGLVQRELEVVLGLRSLEVGALLRDSILFDLFGAGVIEISEFLIG